jgi:hypothetical protein
MYAPDSPASGGSLELEKKIYFGIHCLWSLVSASTGAMAMHWAEVNHGYLPRGMTWIGPSFIIAAVVGLAILYWVLFGPELWSKWACAGCTTLGLLISLGNIFGPNTMIGLRMFPQLQGFDDHALHSFVLVTGIMQLLWTSYFISILSRDALRKQAM